MFNYRVERIIGIEKDKLKFDEKYKEPLWHFLNSNSYTSKKNTGTIIGMTVFGILGFIIFSSTIYLSLLGAILGLGIGRIIGGRFQKRINYQNLDQRIMFEMELICKWAKIQRKKKVLDDVSLILLVETMVMEVSYLLNKLHLKKVRKFFKMLRKFFLMKDTSNIILEYLPSKRTLQLEENIVKRELYRIFNFYIPMLRIFEANISKEKEFRNLEIYEKIYKYSISNECIDSIIEIWSSNQTQSSQCEVNFDRDFISDTIKATIIGDKESEAFKKLENRIMDDIISNVNIEEIQISEEQFMREESKKNASWFGKAKAMDAHLIQAPDCELRQERVSLNSQIESKRNQASYSLGGNHDLDSDDIEMQRKGVKPSNISSQISSSQEEEHEVPEDFLDLQMAVEEDTWTWSKICEDHNVVVFKKKTDGTPMVMIKAISILRGIPKDIVFEAIFDTNIRQSWDKLFHKFEVVEQDDDHTVLYYVIKAPIGISNRDFLQLRRVEHDWPKNGVTYMHFKSIEHEEKPLVKGVVRAETIISGYILEQIEDDPPVTKLVVISQNDIKGLIPKYLVNMASGKAPKQWIANLISGWEQLMKSKDM